MAQIIASFVRATNDAFLHSADVGFLNGPSANQSVADAWDRAEEIAARHGMTIWEIEQRFKGQIEADLEQRKAARKLHSDRRIARQQKAQAREI